MTQKTREVITSAGKHAGTSAVQALVMVAMFRLADAAFDAVTDWIGERRAAREVA